MITQLVGFYANSNFHIITGTEILLEDCIEYSSQSQNWIGCRNGTEKTTLIRNLMGEDIPQRRNHKMKTQD